MKRRIRENLAGAAIVASLILSGCSGDGNSTAPDQTAAQGSSSGQQSTTQASGETVPLTVGVYDRSNMTAEYGTPVDNRWTNWIQEQMLEQHQVEVTFVAIPRTDSDTKITALMAAGSSPDIVFTYDAGKFYQFAGQGGLTALDDLIAQFGPNISQHLDSQILAAGIVGGQLYGIPAKRASTAHTTGYIRKDWLDKIGVTPVERNGVSSFTTDELFDVLSKFKSEGLCKYPMGLEPEKDAYTSGDAETFSFAAMAFVEQDKITEETIACYNEVQWPGVSEGFRYLNRLYNAGLIQPDYAEQSDSSVFSEWITTGQIGFWSHACWDRLQDGQAVPALYQKDSEAKVIAIDICNNDGTSTYQTEYAPYGMFIMIPKTCKNPEAAVKYLNWLCDQKVDEVLRYGIEGEMYEYTEDDSHDIIDLEYYNKTMVSTGDLALPYNGDPNPTSYMHSLTSSGYSEAVLDTLKDAYEIAEVGTWQPVTLGKVIENEVEYKSILIEKLNALRNSAIQCAENDFDTVWKTGVNDYLEAGGQAVLDEKLAAYKEKTQ